MRELTFDLRDSWRGLRRDWPYASAVVITLALTLGASTAVFSIVNGILLRPLAYPEADTLVSIREVLPDESRYRSAPVTMRHFEVWRDRGTSFSGMAAMDWRTSALTGAGEAAQVSILRTSGTLFEVLQTQMARGRPLTREDERADRPRVAVISDRLWRERLGRDGSVLGRPLTLGGVDYTIVGVLPPAYALPSLQTLGESGSVTADFDAVVPFRISLDRFGWMGQFNYGVVARLRPGVTLHEARAEMDVLQETVASMVREHLPGPVQLRGWVVPLQETIAGPVERELLLLLGAIAGVLLIACANLANLTLTRTTSHIRDAAVREALGASRLRLVRSVAVDQLLLATVGGALGLVFAGAALRIFVTLAPVALPRVHDVVIDARVLIFTGAIALLAAAAVAVPPALRVGRGDLEALLRSGGRTTDPGGERLRGALLMTQVAVAVVLLTVSGLFVSSLARLLRVHTGFAPEGAMTVEVAPVAARYPDTAERAALYDRVLERVHALPGVTAAAWTSALPVTGETWVDKIVTPQREGLREIHSSANYRFVGPEYFGAIGMPLLQGRSFSDQERRATPTPAVISANAARLFWPGRDAVGQRFTRADPTQPFEVVGVVPDGRTTALESEPPLMVYVPYWFNNEGKSVLVVRGRNDAGALVAAVRRAVRDVEPELAIARIAPLRQVVDAAVEGRRYQASLFMTFAASALLIALVGVYATTAYGISRRRREMNIRVALGARASQVYSLVLRQSVTPVAAGLALGLAGALASGAAIAGLLYEVRPRDPIVLASVISVVAVVALTASATAARNGISIDPAAALRED